MFWKCKCGRNAANAVKTCRKCGSPKPKIGFIDEKPKGTPRMTPLDDLEKQGKVSQAKVNRKKLSSLPDPEGDNFFVSTFKKK